MRLARRCSPLVLALLAAGCAYYNGVYNARHAESRGDALQRGGRLTDADSLYTLAAVTAETVLVRYPKSRWRDDALRIAGRDWARVGECGRAVPRLRSYLFEFDVVHSASERDPVFLALGECYVRMGRLTEAHDVLAPLITRGGALGREAALWSARASIAKGDDAEARQLLGSADTVEAQWELLRSSIGRSNLAESESLLARRAAAGDGRAAADTALAALWRAGQPESVIRILDVYDRARTPASDLARLHSAVGELFFSSGSDSLAAIQFAATERLSHDSLVVRDAVARLTLLSLAPLSSQADVEVAIRAAHDRSRGGVLQRRLEDNLLLVQMLERHQDFTGASLFLAAEVARDSLRATALAHALFKRVVSSSPQSQLVGKALLAAAQLAPDSAEVYLARLRREYPLSPYLALAGTPDSSALARLSAAETPLQDAWTAVVGMYADSVRKMRPAGAVTAGPPSVAGATAAGAPVAAPPSGAAMPTAGRTGASPP